MHTHLLLSILFLFILASVRSASAAGMNFYDQCLFVPLARYDMSGELTAVGLSARESGTIHWQFRAGSTGGNASGAIAVSANTVTPFFWSSADIGPTLDALAGSLVFCFDRNGNGRVDEDDGDSLSGNAFLIDPSNADVAFVPTINVDEDDLTTTDLDDFGRGRQLIKRLPNVAISGDSLDLQYLIDGAADDGDGSALVIWTNANVAGALEPVTVYDGDGSSVLTEIDFPRSHLNIIDPERVPLVAGGFLGDGFFRWVVPKDEEGDTIYVVAFSLITSPGFGAVQTVLGNY